MKFRDGKKKKEDGGDSQTTKSDETKDPSPGFGNFWRILSFGSRPEHVLLVIAIGCAAASGVPLPVMNIVFGSLVGDFNNYFLPGNDVTESEFKSSVSQSALYIVYLFIGKFVLTYVASFCFRVAGLRVSAAMRLQYLDSLFAQPIKKLDEVSAGTVANTITGSANTIQISVSDRLATLFQSLALVIAAFAIAFSYSWALTLATSSGIVFVIVVYSITTPFALKQMQRVEKADEKHATVAAETISSIRTVFALGAEPKMKEKHTHWVNESDKNGLKLAPQIATQLSPMYFAIYACYALAFWFGLKLYRQGQIDNVNTVIIVFFSVLLVTSVMGGIYQPIANITKAISVSGNFFDMIDSDRVKSDGLREPEVSPHGDLVFENVNFAYPTRPNVKVLDKFTAKFQKGKTTALVGPSGSGKSTVVGLLERWYTLENTSTSQPAQQSSEKSEKNVSLESTSTEDERQTERVTLSGTISLESRNIDDLELMWWRTQIGLVQQEPFLFNETIEENVAHGLIGTQWEDCDQAKRRELVTEACREASADEFINKLPKGYSTKVGESGIMLSGGQRQRIAIARSIIKQPAILILDEATSSIDVQGEKLVQEALERASKNRTTITIAHRLTTISKADHIIVLRNGANVEEGTHEHLLSLEDGLYSSLVRAQKLEEEQGGPSSPETENTRTGIGLTLSRKSTHLSKRRSKSWAIDDANAEEGTVELGYKNKGFVGTVGVILYAQRAHWVLFILLITGAMGCGAANALQSWFFAQLIETFQYTGQRLIDAADFWSLMFFILALAVAISYGVLGLAAGIISTHTGTFCRKDYFKNTLKMPIAYFDREGNASGSVMSRLSGDPKQVQELLGLNGAFPLISIFNITGCVIISFYFGWKLTLVVFFAVMPVIIGASFLRMRYEVQFDEANSKVFTTSSQFATEALGAFRTVSSLTMEDVVISKYRTLLQNQIKESTRKASYTTLVFALSDSIDLCGMALTFWYGGQLLASGEYEPIQFFVIFAAIIQGSQAAGLYLSIIPNAANATTAANRMLEVRSKVENEDQITKQVSYTGTEQGTKIEFKKVAFTYPGNSTPLFSGLDILVEPGQFVAFVGPSGCGKTSTISLLERFYAPNSGTISLDDQDITSMDPISYRHNLALVSQEPRLFSGTVRQNLLLGIEDESTITEKAIEQACRDAEIYEFLISLPQGYGTDLGSHNTIALSGGQKQRLCLARALLRRPKLLLLDEATSSLDSMSEKLVQGAIERLAGQRSMTVVAVAHRLATIQRADVIFVFGAQGVKSGQARGTKIVEQGSHKELLAKRGVYWSMCQSQALDQ